VEVPLLPLSLPKGRVGRAYRVELAAQDTNGAPVFKVVSLPPGMKFSSHGENATLSGKPTRAGTFHFRIRVTDSASPRDSGRRTYKLVVRS
jgi:hypothetical protein